MAIEKLDIDTPKNDLILLAALFLVELSIVVMLLAVHMKGERSFEIFLSSTPGRMFILTVPVFVVASAVIIYQYVQRKRSPLHHYRIIVAMNFITLLLILVSSEIILRAASRSVNQIEFIMGVELVPRNWEKVAKSKREFFRLKESKNAYMVYDDLLGWTVGPNKRNIEGLYSSDSEGIRASDADGASAAFTERAKIAIVGDSFTFGQDVKYEDTWGHFLEKELDSNFQVLNFGVPGYGVDQTYLRYQKDAKKWNPKIVIFGVIAHDFLRTMTVYPTIKFPLWDMPYSKPRFIIRNGGLKYINVPPIHPEDVFSTASIVDLPFLEYDGGYKQNDWQESLWRRLYLIRLLVSKFPSWSENRDTSHAALISVNELILRDFYKSVKSLGAIPIVAYFPTKVEFALPVTDPLPQTADKAKRGLAQANIAKEVLEQAGIPYTDFTPCLLDLNDGDRFVPSKGHYSPQANAAVASCLRRVVTERLAQPG